MTPRMMKKTMTIPTIVLWWREGGDGVRKCEMEMCSSFLLLSPSLPLSLSLSLSTHLCCKLLIFASVALESAELAGDMHAVPAVG